MQVAKARTFLEESSYAKMGPFTYDESGVVTSDSPKKGKHAHRFKGSYHRHTFYVFENGVVNFINVEDDDPLWEA